MTDLSTPYKLLNIIKISLILIIGLSACQPQAPHIQNTVTSTYLPTHVTPKTTQTTEPTKTPTPLPCSDSVGTIVEKEVPSTLLDQSINIKVYLPPCYDRSGATNYSVLYMLHGQTSLDDQWVRIGLLTEMDGLVAQKKIHPFVIVLPNEIRSTMDPFKSKYGDALVEEVIPYVDQHFNVCTKRACRAIGGLSRGGNWSVHLGFSNPELFSAIGAHSAPLFYGERSNIYQLISSPEMVATLPIFYVDVGNKDEDHSEVMLFLDTLQNLNIPHQFSNNLGYHDEVYWRAHVKDYLLWYDSQLMPPSTN